MSERLVLEPPREHVQTRNGLVMRDLFKSQSPHVASRKETHHVPCLMERDERNVAGALACTLGKARDVAVGRGEVVDLCGGELGQVVGFESAQPLKVTDPIAY